MATIDERDEAPHPVGEPTQWSEAYFFHLYDPREALGLRARLAVRPNEGAMDVGLNLFLGDGGFVACRQVRPQTANTADLEVEGVKLQMVEPLRRWRLTYDGPAHALRDGRDASRREAWSRSRLERLIVELDFAASSPPLGSAARAGGNGAAAGPPGAGHPGPALAAPGVSLERFEQPGRFTGSVWVSGDEYAITADGARGKSWGVCEWDAPRLWRSFSAQFGDGCSAAALWMRVGEDDLVWGYVERDGRTSPVAALRLSTETEAGSYLQKSLHLTLDDAAGGRHEIAGELLQVVPLPSSRNGRETVVCDGFARFSYEGRTGYGIAEYLHQLDARGNPVVPVE